MRNQDAAGRRLCQVVVCPGIQDAGDHGGIVQGRKDDDRHLAEFSYRLADLPGIMRSRITTSGGFSRIALSPSVLLLVAETSNPFDFKSNESKSVTALSSSITSSFSDISDSNLPLLSYTNEVRELAIS